MRDSLSSEELALKSITDTTGDPIYFLKREFRTLAELQHPNLVRFHELFSSSDSTFFTMEYVDGAHFGTELRKSRAAKGRLDYDTFRSEVLQLIEGVGYLHAQGKLHRDLKPSNVLVARDGRVVLLDFGLATSAVSRPGGGEDLVGTLAYMAPECFFRAAPAAASDWYAVGVMLYEALAGTSPFPANHTHILAKQRSRFQPLGDAAPGTPESLIALVHSLLAADPSARPSFDALRSALLEPRPPTRRSALPSGFPQRPGFVGRSAELRVLFDALHGTANAGPGLVMVEGRSGEGKTTLIDHFLTEAEREAPALVLKGRCHPSEFVAFKALDGVVDDLSEHLASLAGDDALAYLGPQHQALCRVFPVLSRVGMRSAVYATSQSPRDADLRRAAFAALRDLLQQLSTRQPLIIWIDDLQWGQEDSGRLLSELLRPTTASAILFILSFRSDERASSHCIRVIDAALASSELDLLRVHRVSVQPFDAPDARALVDAVLSVHGDEEAAIADEYAELVVRSGQGNAFILTEFARYVAHGLSEGDVSLEANLGDMLERRFQRLPDLAQRIASIAAIAGRPLTREVLLGASAADVRGPAMLHVLLKSSLLRAVDIDTQSSYVIYHDQIRQALISSLSPPEQVSGHAQIAETLLASLAPDPEHVLEHLLQAEQRGRAAPFAFEAAVRASKTLAFERASSLFELALALGYSGEAAWSLQMRQAEALANAGRGERAAEVYLTAAQSTPTEQHSATDLRRRAAEQFLHAGCLGQGQHVLIELLEGIGVQLPKSTLEATLRSLSGRAWINLKGRKYTIHPTESIDAEALARVDLLWAGTTGLSLINHTQSDAINVQLLREALKLGERSRISRVLGFEAASEASIGGFLAARSKRTLSEASGLAADSEDPYDRAFVLQASSVVHWFQERWQQAVDDAERSIALYRSLERGTQWEQSVVQSFRLSALAHLGRFDTLAAQLPDLIHDAQLRGDTFAAAVLDGCPSYSVWLARDNPDRALELTQQAVRPWPKTAFLSPHYRHLLTSTCALLYQGRHREAFEQLSEIWPSVRQARFLMLSFIGSELRFLRGRALLAHLAASTQDVERRVLLGELEAETKHLASQGSLYARAASNCLKAGLLEHLGSPILAARALDTASGLFERLEMSALLHGCRLLQARLQQDGNLQASAMQRLTEMGVAKPERFARCLIVGDVRGSGVDARRLSSKGTLRQTNAMGSAHNR